MQVSYGRMATENANFVGLSTSKQHNHNQLYNKAINNRRRPI